MRTLPLGIALTMLLAAAQSPNPLTQAVRTRYEAVKRNLVESAEAMPEDQYSFRLTPPQRTFGEWIGHTAITLYGFCSPIKAAPQPDTKPLHALTAKTDLVKALREAFDYCDSALEGMTDARALSGDVRRGYPVQAMISLIASCNEHYGNLVGYLRAKGVTPPSSARQNVHIPEQGRQGRKPPPPERR